MKKIISVAVVIVVLGAMVSACSVLRPQLETPQLSIVNVEALGGTVFEQNMKVRMRVQNPNDRALPIRGLSYTLDVSGEELAQGVSDKSFLVPALGETEFDMTVRTNMALALLKLAGKQNSSAKDSIDYRIRGKISLSEGLLRSIPFSHSGKFQLK